jgi:hypothetical protein
MFDHLTVIMGHFQYDPINIMSLMSNNRNLILANQILVSFSCIMEIRQSAVRDNYMLLMTTFIIIFFSFLEQITTQTSCLCVCFSIDYLGSAHVGQYARETVGSASFWNFHGTSIPCGNFSNIVR